jgi:oxygen-independent coproporphyrinogen-3 oxidase
MLKSEGYEDVGMDHFALSHDSILKAQTEGKLQRNFMGYTTTETELLIGLGSSAISDAKYAYAQNAKKVEDYSLPISNGVLAITKGHIQTEEDLQLKKHILEVACQSQISSEDLIHLKEESIIKALDTFCAEGILERKETRLHVTESGRAFIRNICRAFDLRQQNPSNHEKDQLFSKGI